MTISRLQYQILVGQPAKESQSGTVRKYTLSNGCPVSSQALFALVKAGLLGGKVTNDGISTFIQFSLAPAGKEAIAEYEQNRPLPRSRGAD